ncbi:hypothetical protein LSM04_006349 [Trypanosoma melophagium]|uniref:uncharacterized protein n=1 Tax=Trypanosoma melophagium TaxID=715481 RepID=UPI00351A5515|nr:hypothetical protein LSM04_006349 [Trypanosoma melophagium]
MTNENVMPRLGGENILTAERLQNPSTDAISGGNTAVAAPIIGGDVYNEEKGQVVSNDITANTDVNVIKSDNAFDRTGSSSDMQNIASTEGTETPERTTLVNNRNSVPSVAVKNDKDKKNNGDSNNHGISIGGEKNGIKNVSPTQRAESENGEAPKNTIKSSKEAPVIPTETKEQGIEISNTLVYNNLVSPSGDGSLYFTSLLTLLLLLGTTIVVTLF